MRQYGEFEVSASASEGQGIGSPCSPPRRGRKVRIAIRDDGAAAVGHGCPICGGPSDLVLDPRETAQRSDWRGKAFLVTSWASKKSLAAARRAGETPHSGNPAGIGMLGIGEGVWLNSLGTGVSGMMRHHLATGDDASIMVVRLPVGPFFFGAHWVRPDTTDLEHEQ